MRDTHEIWKPIRETEGKYSVSNMGRVKNNETGTVLKAIPIGRGYLKVNLHLKGMRVEEAVSTPLYKKGRPRKEVICEQLTIKKNTTYE